MTTAAVKAIETELDRLSKTGRIVDLWWRDDDAVRDGPELDRLLRITKAAAIPVALATIPSRIQRSLIDRVATEAAVSVLVHGLHHANHAPLGEKPSEFGPHRPASELASEAEEGLRRTVEAFGSRVCPVFVPPWNRFDPDLVPHLAELGYRGVSAFGSTGSTADGLPRRDTHLDPVDWRGTRSLAAPERLAAAFRRGAEGGSVGILTHHLVFDDSLWRFCADLAGMVARHPAVRFRAIGDLLADERRAEPPPRDRLPPPAGRTVPMLAESVR